MWLLDHLTRSVKQNETESMLDLDESILIVAQNDPAEIRRTEHRQHNDNTFLGNTQILHTFFKNCIGTFF